LPLNVISNMCFSCIAAVILSGGTYATAETFGPPKTSLRLVGQLGTAARVVDQSSDIAATELRFSPSLSAQGRVEWQNADGRQIYLDPGITVNLFPSQTDLNEARLSLFGEYRFNLTPERDKQIRLRTGIERLNRFPDERFIRYTAQGALRVRHARGRSSIYTLRYRYRDQNEANSFDGFDQNELFGSVRYAWAPPQGRVEQIAVTPYFDLRDAEGQNFSYDEFGIRVQSRYRLRSDVTLNASARAFVRDYKDVFSAVFPIERNDTRTAFEVELRKAYSPDTSFFTAVGWETNRSNIPVRDYQGLTLRFGIEVTLR